MSLNQNVYRALAALAPPTNDPATKHYLERTLLEYRLSGVDKDEATRERFVTLQDKITAPYPDLQSQCGRWMRKVTATRAELDGMPADYIARHKPDADGIYTLTTDPPDSSR